MRRCQPPFNGKRYLLNLNTGEIHDLDQETSQCKIDEISPDHIFTSDDAVEVQIEAGLHGLIHANGCYYCNRSKDIG